MGAESRRSLHFDVVGPILPRMAVIAQQLPRKNDVVGGDRRAIGKGRPGIKLKSHIGAVGIGLDRTREQAVKRERFVVTAGHQAFDHRPTKRVRPLEILYGQTFAVEWIEAVEGAENALRQLAALRRVRVDVRESREARRKRRLAMHRDGVLRVRRAGTHYEAARRQEGRKGERHAGHCLPPIAAAGKAAAIALRPARSLCACISSWSDPSTTTSFTGAGSAIPWVFSMCNSRADRGEATLSSQLTQRQRGSDTRIMGQATILARDYGIPDA